MTPSWLCKLFCGAWCLIVMNGTSMVGAEPCQAEEHPVYTTKGRICCPKCDRRIEQEKCKHDILECRCRQGYGCASTSCTNCKVIPECKEGRINITEKASNYVYQCEKCPSGTVLDLDSGLCKPVEIPSTTLQSPSTRTPTTEGLVPSPISNNMWIIFVSVVFCLLLITIIIHLLIRTLRTAKPLKDLVPSRTNISINMKEDGDTWSYQYPEEEHGDGALSNKQAAF